jgi:hypothetical protein
MLTSRQNVGTLTVRVSAEAASKPVLSQIRQIVRAHGIDLVTIELERAQPSISALDNGKTVDAFEQIFLTDAHATASRLTD